MAYEVKCEACGQVFRGQTREQAAQELQEHNRQMHGQAGDREQILQKVHQTA